MNLPFLRNFSGKIILSFLIFFSALYVFVQIIDEVVLEQEQDVDLWIFQFFENYIIHNRLTDFMYSVTHFCSTPFVQIAYPTLIVVLVIFKYYRRALFTFVAGAGGLLLIYLNKIFFQRPRPLYPLLYKEEGYSFPSGHATFSFIFYGTLAYFVWLSNIPKALKTAMIVFLLWLSLSIGISRIYLMVHYPSDVLAGFCLGYSWLFMLIYFFRKKYGLQ